MLIRVASDIHLEFIKRWCKGMTAFSVVLPEDPSDKFATLILAGDILVATGADSSIMTYEAEWEYITSRFKYVIYINGNHDHYGGTFFRNIERQKKASEKYSNLFFLEKDRIILDGQGFIGTTLWTNIPPQYYMPIQRGMSDYSCIKQDKLGDDYYICVEDTNKAFAENKKYLEEHIQQDDIVITHHSPSFKSVHKKYVGDYFNYGYHNDLDNIVLDTKPKLWVHGHTHETMDYMIGDTRVICNPRGYESYDHGLENTSWKDKLFLII